MGRVGGKGEGKIVSLPSCYMLVIHDSTVCEVDALSKYCCVGDNRVWFSTLSRLTQGLIDFGSVSAVRLGGSKVSLLLGGCASGVCVYVCVCVCERERERERGRESVVVCVVCVCVCVCVFVNMCVSVCVSVCVCERERVCVCV